MTAEWYCNIAGREIGPLSPQQLKAMAEKGQILPNDCVRRGAESEWVIARQIEGLLPASDAPPPVAAPPVADVDRSRSVPRPPPAPPPIVASKDAPPLDPASIRVNTDPLRFDADSLPARVKRQRERQAKLIGVLLGGILLLGVVGAYMWFDGGKKRGPSGLAEQAAREDAENPKPKKPVYQSPEALEKLEGVVPLDKPLENERKDISEILGLESETAKQPAAGENKEPIGSKDDAAAAGDGAEAAKKNQKNPLLDHQWIDASTAAAIVGFIAVRIVSAEIAPPLDGEAGSPPRILLTVSVQNGGVRDVDFQGWTRGGVARGAKLFDEKGEPLAAKAVGRAALPGRGPPLSLPQGGEGKELLAFAAPPEDAEYVLLELPATAFGVKAIVRMKVPAAMIVARQPDQTQRGNPDEPPHTPESDFGLPEADETIE